MRIGDSHVYQPGEIVPVSGQYCTVTPTGEKSEKTVLCEKEARFPAVSPNVYGFLLATPSNQGEE